ncbi:MAG: peptide methionine sulfoxide reductase MsrA [Micavibrio sp.]|nr:MAG: peptide methionine sulfoxide reductase MsrA [Micavibrio sp.]
MVRAFILKIIFLSLVMVPGAVKAAETTTAIFAGGCFWCIEKDLEHVEGVSEVVSGYTGGHVENPAYKQVSSGGTGHYEAVQVTYDPEVLSYSDLLKSFWVNVDPHDARGQFCDKGDQYRAGIFTSNEEEKKVALASKEALENSGQLSEKIVTKILPVSEFFLAEDYHQDYYKKSKLRYDFYRARCGRDNRLKKVWGDVDVESILK